MIIILENMRTGGINLKSQFIIFSIDFSVLESVRRGTQIELYIILTKTFMTTAKNKTTSKKQPPVLINQQALINRLLQSISNYSGFSEEYIKDGTEHLCSHWRKMGCIYLLKSMDSLMKLPVKCLERKLLIAILL